MGSSASKASRTAAGAAARKYPSRPSPSVKTPSSAPPPQATTPGPRNHPPPQASSTRDEAINLDGSDPQYAANLRRIGIVQPNPFFSPPSSDPHETVSSYRHSPSSPASSGPASAPTNAEPPPPNFFPSAEPNSNPALRILQARQQLQDEAERELENFGKREFEGRKFLDAGSIRDALTLRDAGVESEEIERRIGMKRGSLQKLGSKGIVENVV